MASPVPPQHILIVGSGVFALTTAYALSQRPAYRKTCITIVSYELSGADANTPSSPRPTERATPASIDTTRIIRADYADSQYARLASEAQRLWRTNEWGGDGRYFESGLLLTVDHGSSRETYVRKSLENMRKQQGGDGPSLLATKGDVANAMSARAGVAKGSGSLGYVNKQSGWANAETCIRLLETKVRKSGRVEFVQGEAARLDVESGSNRIRGVVLADGRAILADLTVLATGAWTPTLVDLRGRASANAQVMAYFDISNQAAKALEGIPVHLNIASGCFLFPPNRKADGGWEIKAARHSYGYTNPVLVPAPLGCDGDVEISVPVPSSVDIPVSDQLMLSEFLETALPVLGKISKPSRTRLCHYLDTKSGDFIVSYHPSFRDLFIATGGSGHAFKFLPALGEKILDVLSGTDESLTWTQKWRFPDRQSEDTVWCDDGSRSGQKNLRLADATRNDPKARL